MMAAYATFRPKLPFLRILSCRLNVQQRWEVCSGEFLLGLFGHGHLRGAYVFYFHCDRAIQINLALSVAGHFGLNIVLILRQLVSVKFHEFSGRLMVKDSSCPSNSSFAGK